MVDVENLTSYEKMGLPISLTRPWIFKYRKPSNELLPTDSLDVMVEKTKRAIKELGPLSEFVYKVVDPEFKPIFPRGDRYTCFYCERRTGKAMTIDHIIPVSKGGNSTEFNKVYACRTCNHFKGAKSLSEFIVSVENISQEYTTADHIVVIRFNAPTIIKNIEKLLEYKSKHKHLMTGRKMEKMELVISKTS